MSAQTQEPNKPEKTQLELRKKHPLAIRWFHWLNFPLLAVMIWSGLLIYWANDVYGVRFGNTEIVRFFPEKLFENKANGTAVNAYSPPAPSWMPDSWKSEGMSDSNEKYLYRINNRLAEGMAWHFLFMWFFTINGLLYVLFTAFSGQWRFLVPRRGTLKHAWLTVLHDLHLRKQPPTEQKFNGAQQIAYTSIIVMGIGSVLTGIAVYKPTQASWLAAVFGGYGAARFIHFWLMMGYVAFFLVHVAQVIKTGWNNFRAMVTGYELHPVEPAPEAATGGGPA